MFKNCSLIVISIVCIFIFCRCLKYFKKRRRLYLKNLSISQLNLSIAENIPKNILVSANPAPTSTINYKTTDPQPEESSCDSILENGKWENFKKYGSWQRYNMDAENRIIVNEKPMTKYRLDAVFYDGKIQRNTSITQSVVSSEAVTKEINSKDEAVCNYPYHYTTNCKNRPTWGNGFYLWKRQNYSGTWTSNNKNCPLTRLSKPDIDTCFKPKNGSKKFTIRINGDSVSRQIFLTTIMYLKTETENFYDNPGNQYGVSQNNNNNHQRIGLSVNENVNIFFYWDSATTEIRKVMKTKKTAYDIDNVSLLIVGPKVLHPMDKFDFVFKNQRPEQYFENFELPKIRNLLKKNHQVYVYVVAQHYVHRNRGGVESRTYKAYDVITRYNKRVRELVINVGHTRLKYVGVVEKLGFIEQENLVLAVDGTHWNWKKDKNTKRQENVPISPASLGLLDVIFNHFCFYK